MSESLRNIGENYLAIKEELLNSIDSETGEIIGDANLDLLHELENIQESFSAKAQNVALVCLELRDRKEAIKREIERLQSLLKSAERGEEWLRGYLSEAMDLADCERIIGDRIEISFRSSEETVIDNLNFIPQKYLNIKTTYVPDKKAIKTAIKNGEEVDGAHIEKKKNLQIK